MLGLKEHRDSSPCCCCSSSGGWTRHGDTAGWRSGGCRRWRRWYMYIV